MAPGFGIDFGTTNTRVAYFDGQRVRMVPFRTAERGTVYQLPTAVAYQGGEPIDYGFAARLQTRGTLFPQPLKWILDSPEPVEVAGGVRDRVEVVADFLRHVRELAAASMPKIPLNRASVTIPVHYPAQSRARLGEAFRRAGIEITNFFYEPIAAIYAGLADGRTAGVTAVFDWGGGSLDVATVQVRDGMALTRHVEGWHRGGTDFDRTLAEHAVVDFLGRNPDIKGVTAEQILRDTQNGRRLRLSVEDAKIELGTQPQAAIQFLGFLANRNLDFPLSRALFDEIIEPDLVAGIARLDLSLRASGVTWRTLTRLFLSGGTCNIPAIRDRLTAQVAGHRLVDALQLPAGLRDPLYPGGLQDIGNATAVGAALLAVHGARPEFASSVGVRLAGADGSGFFTVFPAGSEVTFNAARHRFYVSDASSKVARLMVCEQSDAATEAGGRLLRLITVPIEATERWLEVEFAVDRHLALRVRAAGQMSIPKQAGQMTANWPFPPEWVQALNLGFRLPRPAQAA